MSKALTILQLITYGTVAISFPSTVISLVVFSPPWREELKGLACCLDVLENHHNK